MKFYFFVETSPFHCHRSNHAFFHENHEMHFTASVCEKNNSTNNSIELEKGQIHSGITLTEFAMIESRKFHQVTKHKSRIEKRKDRLALRSTASYFFRNTEKRYPYVTTTTAQQQLSSSTVAAAAQQKQQRRRWWRWRRRRRKRRQHGKPFFAQLSQQHRGPPEGEGRPKHMYEYTIRHQAG